MVLRRDRSDYLPSFGPSRSSIPSTAALHASRSHFVTPANQALNALNRFVDNLYHSTRRLPRLDILNLITPPFVAAGSFMTFKYSGAVYWC